MAADDLDSINQRLHATRRQIESVQWRLFEEGRFESSAAPATELAQLHKALLALEGEQRDLLRSGPSDERRFLGRDTTQLTVEVLPRMSHVPSGIAHLLDEKTPLVSVRITNHRRSPARVRVRAHVEGYSAEAIDTVEIPKDEVSEINLLPVFFPGPLRGLNELTRASLVVDVDDLDGKKEQHRSYAIWMLARSTAINGVTDPATGGWTDLTHYYGAWVTPAAPAVRDLLSAAAAAHPKHRLVGYKTDRDGVEAQVQAIFDAVAAKDLKYVNSSRCYGSWEGRLGQRVRLPAEVLTQESANCIDGTLLMASLLEAASLNPALVFIPQHALLGWEIQENSRQWDYLETTLIGGRDFRLARDKGRERAASYESLHALISDGRFFTRHPLFELRALRGITPLE
jgi:hypothetical protein